MGKLKKFLLSNLVMEILFIIINNEVNADIFLGDTINNYHWGYYLAIILVTLVVIAISIIILLIIGKNNSNSNNQKADEENRKDGSV